MSGSSVPKLPDLITQVKRNTDDDEYIDDYSGGISARRDPGEGVLDISLNSSLFSPLLSSPLLLFSSFLPSSLFPPSLSNLSLHRNTRVRLRQLYNSTAVWVHGIHPQPFLLLSSGIRLGGNTP